LHEWRGDEGEKKCARGRRFSAGALHFYPSAGERREIVGERGECGSGGVGSERERRGEGRAVGRRWS